MSTTTHTPGPWRQWRATDGSVNIVNSENAYVALVGGLEGADEKAAQRIEADARLIAAAPELLAALEALKEWGCTYTGPRDPNSPHALLIAAHDAIAKVKGGAS